MYNNSSNNNGTLPTMRGIPRSTPLQVPFQQIHPAFQGINNRYSNQLPHHQNVPLLPPTQEFNASAISPMFFGYSSTNFSKL